MTDEVKILKSADAIPQYIAPTGVQYKAFRLGEPHLWEVFAVRKDDEGKVHPDKTRKQPIEGVYTSEAKAHDALRRWLSVRWMESDAESEKLAKRKAA